MGYRLFDVKSEGLRDNTGNINLRRDRLAERRVIPPRFQSLLRDGYVDINDSYTLATSSCAAVLSAKHSMVHCGTNVTCCPETKPSEMKFNRDTKPSGNETQRSFLTKKIDTDKRK